MKIKWNAPVDTETRLQLRCAYPTCMQQSDPEWDKQDAFRWLQDHAEQVHNSNTMHYRARLLWGMFNDDQEEASE